MTSTPPQRSTASSFSVLDNVVHVYRHVLGDESVDAETNFFTAGGQSLDALRALAELRRLLDSEIPVEAIVNAPTARQMANQVLHLQKEKVSAASTAPIAAALHGAIGEVRHLGVQLYASIDGQVVWDRSEGTRENSEPLRSDDLLPWFSASKPVTAAAVVELSRRGAVDLDAPLSRYLPELSDGDSFTLRHVLTHTTGPLIGSSSVYTPDVGHEAALTAALARRLPPDAQPGHQSSYQASQAGWLMMAEVIRRVDGRRFDHWIRDEIFEPLGMQAYFGFDDDELKHLGDRVTTYDRGRRAAFRDERDAAELASDLEMLQGRRLHRCLDPSSGLWADARSMGRFYEHLCDLARGGEGLHPGAHLSRAAVAEMVRPQRPPLLEDLPLIVTGLGVTLESRAINPEHPINGSHTGPRTFGQQGHGSSPMAYADPDAGIVVSFNGNGLPGRVIGKLIWHAVSDAVYAQALGL